MWKKIRDYNYEVNESGEVRNINTLKILKGSPDTKGYIRVTLYSKGKATHISIHRLVCKYFYLNFNENLQVNHKDGNKTNNNIDNLEMVTSSENNIHALDNNLRKTRKPIISINSCGINTEHISIMHCAKELNISPSAIRNQLKGLIKNVKGYTFKLIKTP